jgi:di/tricarboxylate transporter
MTLDQILVFITLAFILISLYFSLMGAALTFMIGVLFLAIAGIITPTEMLQGFGNEQIWVIIVLLIIGDIIRKQRVLDRFFNNFIFSNTKSTRWFIFRMAAVVAPLSAILNNTPLVAIIMPYVSNWSRQYKVDISKLLIPLSYAAILGGSITLIGTSTNLIVDGLLKDQTLFPETTSLNMFDFTIVGLPMLVIGVIYLVLFSDKLLPNKQTVTTEVMKNPRKYIVDTLLSSKSNLVGKTVEEANLRNLQGLFLAEVNRADTIYTPVSPGFKLMAGDILTFAGDTDTIGSMLEEKNGLDPIEVGMFVHKKQTQLTEIVISHNSTIVNKSIKSIGFRGKFDAVVVAVHRNGERINGKIGSIKLKAGDVLLLLTGADFNKLSRETSDFYQLSKGKVIQKPKILEGSILIGGLLISIILSSLHIIPLSLGVLSTLISAVAFKIINPRDLKYSLDYNLVIIIAASLSLGTAMINTGAADMLANGFLPLFKPFGVLGLLTGLYLITTILAAYITNKAAVALMFPIALSLAYNQGLNPIPFVLLVAFASAANFLTPIGYQTNLMVYGPGNYSFKDFFKIGLPLTIIYMIVTVLILYYWYFLRV